ncbi:MAG: protein kinase [Kofleriaceae bacterium]|nr:protein kinase [Kofleriaceae bacterium]
MSNENENWRPGDPIDLEDARGPSPSTPAWRTEIDSQEPQVPRRPGALAVGTGHKASGDDGRGGGTAIPAAPPPVAPHAQPATPVARGTMPSTAPRKTMLSAAAVPDPTLDPRTVISGAPQVPPRAQPVANNSATDPRTMISGAPQVAPRTPDLATDPRTMISGVAPVHTPAHPVTDPRTMISGAAPAPRPSGLAHVAPDPRTMISGAAPAPSPVVSGRHTVDANRPPTAPSASPPAVEPEGIELRSGTKLGQFELIRELGRGGMGQVFLARDVRLARLVALKFLGHASRELTERFLVEARATARCQHENIVVIYEADEWQGKPYMALEYLEGETLSKLLENGPLAASRALELIVPVVRALVRAHEHGIVHCDLKPDNIFVTKEGVVKVLDFGIARALGQASVDVASGLKDSGISGTMPFMSPEQWGADEVDHRTDLWSVGIILWEMLTKRHPLDPISQQRLIHAASNLDTPMPRIGEAMPQLPAAFEQVIDQCLAKYKEHRFATARDLLAQLEPQLPGRFGRRLDENENPFPGMTAFQENDADRFFGRDRDVAHMVTRMADHPLVGVVAPSGVGKSSFLRAGVIPALKASGETWEVFVTRPGRHPLSSLATLLQPFAANAGQDLRGAMQDHDALLARLRNEPGFLGTLLRARARQKQERIMLFVDQFEELYTMCPDADERRAYTAVLAGIADDAATPLRVVVSMRSDFLDRAAEDRVFMDRLTRGLLFLPPVDRDGMREALLAPLGMVGYRFEHDTMVDEMVDALAGAPGALPLLQFTAAMLWESRDRTRRVLTAQSYEAIGGVGGALASHADHVLAAMSPERQKLARAVFLRLVTVEGTRAIVDVAELTSLSSDGTEIRALLDQLVGARLLVVQSREDGAVVEIVHESMLTRWPTLRRWLDESTEDAAFLEQLRTAAKQWDARGRAQGLLWRGEAMEDARTFARRFKGALPARERAYLDAVLALATAAGRRKRRLIIAGFVVLGGLFATAMVGMLYIRDAEQTAQEQRKVAETETKRAEDQMQRAETETKRAREAEAKVIAQMDELKKAEAARLAAEKTTEVAQTNLASAQETVEKQGEDLEKTNAKLKRSLADSEQKAKALAEASKKLEIALAKEKAEKAELQKKFKQLATELK